MKNQIDFFAHPERQNAWHTIVYQQQIIRSFQALRENKIEPILIKGWSIEQFYPADKKRLTADVDLCVAPKDYQKSLAIIKSLGFHQDAIDLHKGLRHLDKLPWANLFDNSRLLTLHNESIRVLRPEDSLRVACVHWLNDGGANREKLWDIYYLIKNRPVDFDWQRCLDSNGVKRRKWIVCAIAAAHRFLAVPLENTPLVAEVESALPAWFVPALEKEWNHETKSIRLENLLLARDWQSFGRQLKKRFSPNAIAASVATEAAFDDAPRLPFQIADFIVRFTIHFKRNVAAVFKFLLTNTIQKN